MLSIERMIDLAARQHAGSTGSTCAAATSSLPQSAWRDLRQRQHLVRLSKGAGSRRLGRFRSAGSRRARAGVSRPSVRQLHRRHQRRAAGALRNRHRRDGKLVDVIIGTTTPVAGPWDCLRAIDRRVLEHPRGASGSGQAIPISCRPEAARILAARCALPLSCSIRRRTKSSTSTVSARGDVGRRH